MKKSLTTTCALLLALTVPAFAQAATNAQYLSAIAANTGNVNLYENEEFGLGSGWHSGTAAINQKVFEFTGKLDANLINLDMQTSKFDNSNYINSDSATIMNLNNDNVLTLVGQFEGPRLTRVQALDLIQQMNNNTGNILTTENRLANDVHNGHQQAGANSTYLSAVASNIGNIGIYENEEFGLGSGVHSGTAAINAKVYEYTGKLDANLINLDMATSKFDTSSYIDTDSSKIMNLNNENVSTLVGQFEQPKLTRNTALALIQQMNGNTSNILSTETQLAQAVHNGHVVK